MTSESIIQRGEVQQDSVLALERAADAQPGARLDRVLPIRGALAAARYVFQNGLTVLLAIDRRAPLFAYHTWLRVGSKHEDPGRTGLAHLLEHMMFKATERFPNGTLDREMELRGAQTNAATWVDWTYYHQTLACRGDNLTRVAELEADRLQGLAFDPATFASELEVVRNERRMTIDDSALGALGEAVYETAFAQHPYRTQTIGRPEHLASTTLDHVRDFYRAHYAPDQAVLVIAGDLDPAETLSVLYDAYGSLSPSGRRPRAIAPEPEQREERRVEITRSVQVPYVTVAYHIPGQLHPDYPSLEALAEVAFVGDNARVYRRLVVEERLASDVEGYLTPFAEPGLCEVVVTLRPGSSVDAVVDRVQEELEGIAVTLSDEELEKATHGLELAYYEELRDADGVAELMGHFEVAHGDYTRAFEGTSRLKSVNRNSVARACSRVFRGENRTVGVLRPRKDRS